MQLSPLQSRLAASIIASCLLIALYLFLFSPKFALAAELVSNSLDLGHDDGGVDRWNMEFTHVGGEHAEPIELRSSTYEPVFPLFDRSIIGRAPAGVTGLANNAPMNTNLDPGTTAKFVFEVSSLSAREKTEDARNIELRKRASENGSQGDEAEIRVESNDGEMIRRQQSTKTLFISATTCMQPEGLSPNQTSMDPPQLTLYVSTSSKNTAPGPMADKDTQEYVIFDEGAVMYNTTLQGDVFFTVAAPNVSEAFASRLYNVDVAASIDQYYHSFNDSSSDPELLWVDSDSSSTLFTTRNLTDNPSQVIQTPPYTMFAFSQDYTSVNGVKNSMCGLKQYAQIGGSKSSFPSNMMKMALSNKGFGGLTKQEFYLRGLNSSTKYMGILAKGPSGNGQSKRENIPGGGGAVFRQVEFDTKQNGTCQFVFNLTFCDQTAYAVPGNPSKFDAIELGQVYDKYAQQVYDNFNKSMQQIPCEAENAAKYSLARGCDDCRLAYKNWLCSVTIPRCEDFTKGDDFLQMRNINALFPDGTTPVPDNIKREFGSLKAFNQSRVPQIDDVIQPGPYKEVLPCDELCYDLVQSCPASLQFSCPLPGQMGFNTSYGQKRNMNDANITCNYPGAVHVASGANAKELGWVPVVAGTTIVFLLMYSTG